MLTLDSERSYYFCGEPVSFRYRHKGLRGFINGTLRKDPTNGDVYIFLSKDGHRLRLYYYSRRGEIMTEKIMHDSRFIKPVFDADKNAYRISWDNFVYMLESVLPRGREVDMEEVEDLPEIAPLPEISLAGSLPDDGEKQGLNNV